MHACMQRTPSVLHWIWEMCVSGISVYENCGIAVGENCMQKGPLENPTTTTITSANAAAVATAIVITKNKSQKIVWKK